tara:strand:+ start:158 stop:412 length:255 start_codon:yes stop_codon:yes gene_type:complete
MISKLEKIKPGSYICDPNDPKKIYQVIEHLTVFDGFDLGCYGDNEPYAYGETKRIARCKIVGKAENVYRFPVSKKMLYLSHCPV